MIFVEAPTSEQQIIDIAKRLPGFKLMQHVPRRQDAAPPVSQLEKIGYQS